MVRRRIPGEELAEFCKIVMPMMARNATWLEMANATGLTIGGVKYRVNQILGQKKRSSFAPVESMR